MAVLVAVAALCLALAIHTRDGEYWPSAMKWLAAAIALALIGVAVPRLSLPQPRAVLVAALALCLAVQFFLLYRSPPSGWNEWSNDVRDLSAAALRPYRGGLIAAALFTLAILIAPGVLRRIGFVLLLACFGALGVWLIRAAPDPHIDVHVFQQEGGRVLLEGRNPYAVRMPDIYAGTKQAIDRDVYGKGLSKEGTLEFGFPYPPLSLFMSTAGYAAAGDHRYAQLAAMVLAAALAGGAVGGRAGMLAAALLLFTPRAFFILGRGWTEPFVALGLAATLWCAVRMPRLLPVALGLFLATKQYLIFVVPLTALLVQPPFRWSAYLKLIVSALVVAAAVTLPLALWDRDAFVHSLYTVQKIAPFREDALSFLVTAHHHSRWPLPAINSGIQLRAWIAFAIAVSAMGLALCRAPRGAAGFSAAIGLTYLLFVAFNKQAFANYYYFVLAALCFAAATSDAPDRRAQTS